VGARFLQLIGNLGLAVGKLWPKIDFFVYSNYKFLTTNWGSIYGVIFGQGPDCFKKWKHESYKFEENQIPRSSGVTDGVGDVNRPPDKLTVKTGSPFSL